jgi:transcriptional regulator with XRE-family HTH domain
MITPLRRARDARGWKQSKVIALMEESARRRGVRIAESSSLKTMLSDWERGKRSLNLTENYRDIFREIFETTDEQLGFGASGSREIDLGGVTVQDATNRLEALRSELSDVISGSSVGSSSLDTWDESVFHLGLTARNLPPEIFVADLASDIADLRATINRSRSASTMRRLTRVAAQMSGLMCLTLIKLDERDPFRKWARTARIAATEVEDPETTSWIFAQEAYGHFYAGDFHHAIEVSRYAQEVARGKPYVGAVLAAALEARTQASIGHDRETRDALHRAESILSRLDDSGIGTSAFAYNEAQLRFHEGNALTHLHDTEAAWTAQQRALALYPSGDYMDRALIMLDRASCLAHDGDTASSVQYATEVLTNLSEPQRRGIITLRAGEAISAIPARDRKLSTVRGFQDLLLPPTRTQQER